MDKLTRKVFSGVALSVLLPFLAFSAPASASPSESRECTPENPENCLNGVGPAVTNPDSMRITATQVVEQTNRETDSENEKQAFLGTSARSGLSAGEGISGLGLWGSFGYSDFSADIPINSAVQPIASYDGDQKSIFLGMDKLYMNKLVLGLALGYEKTDFSTAYNGGNSNTDGYTFAPYAAYLINKYFSLDVAGGYSYLNTDTDRIDNLSGGTIDGDFDSDRWFVSGNLNATMEAGNWVLGGRVGALYIDEEQDAYTETGPNTPRAIGKRHIDLTQGLIGVNIAYRVNQFEPYGTVTYVNDFGRDNGTKAGGLPGAVGSTQPDDDDEIQAGLGFRYFGETYSGSFEWVRTFNRDSFDADSFLFTYRADF